jgi:hypothetical protein
VACCQLVLKLAAENGLYHTAAVDAARLEVCDRPAPAEYCDAVSKLEHLVHPVAHINDRHTGSDHRLHDGEEAPLLGLGKARCRLVHDQYSDVAGYRYGDLDELPLAKT